MKKFLIVLMLVLIGYSAFAESATDYIEYSWEAYEKWYEMVIKYNATQWVGDGDPTWAMFELFCENIHVQIFMIVRSNKNWALR